MGKKYEGYEIIEAIAKKEINLCSELVDNYGRRYKFKGDKLLVLDEDDAEWEEPGYNIFIDKNIKFEIVDMGDIQNLNDFCTNTTEEFKNLNWDDSCTERELRNYISNNINDLNKIIAIIKSLDKRIKKIEGGN